MTAAKKSAAVRKRKRRQREREQPRTARLPELTAVMEKNIRQTENLLDKYLIRPMVEQGE